MSKDEFAEELRRRGYEVVIDKGYVMVIDEKENRLMEIEKIARESGVKGGYGWRSYRKGDGQ